MEQQNNLTRIAFSMMSTHTSRNRDVSRTTAIAKSRVRFNQWIGAACVFAGMQFASFTLHASDLTIDDGVVVKFGTDAQLVVRDRLSAGKGIVFTSSKDDAVGGQSGPAPQSAAAGDWLGLRWEKTAAGYGAASLSDFSVRYGGAVSGSAVTAALTIRGFSPSLQYVQITDSKVGLRTLNAAAPSITGSSFLRNEIGLETDGNSAPIIGGSSQFSQNTTQAILNKTPATIIQATGNWWGHTSGPKDAVSNPAGQGDVISTGVNYGNYLVAAPLLNPSIRLAAPATYYQDHTLSFDISCINASEYRLAEGNAFAGVNFQSLTNGAATVPFTVSSGDGQKSISVQFRHANGNVVTAALSGGVLIDAQPPSLVITSPAASSVITGSVAVEADASDAAGIASVQFFVNGQLKSTDTAAPFVYSWNNDGLADGSYAIKVIATDIASRSTERTNTVTLARVAPPPDTDGPTLANLRFNGSALADGQTLSRSGSLTIDGSDRSGVSRVELLLDNAVVATATGSGTYTVTLSLDGVANGSHTLSINARDSLNNLSSTTVSIVVAHQPPLSPTLTSPANGLTTGEAQVVVTGTSQKGNVIKLLNNGQSVGDAVTVTSSGTFSVTVALVSGANQLQATAADQYGVSALSSAITVTRDTSVTSSPSNLTATASAAGKIHLSWAASTDAKTVGYNLYRSLSPFNAIGEAVKVNASKLTSTVFDDMPSQDGTYHYRVVALNAVGNASNPTNSAQAVADSALPRAITITYSPRGKVDALSGRVGQGQVDVALTVSEALQTSPYLAVVPQGGQPITVDLTKVDDTHYSGAFLVDANTPSGLTNALFSARDLVGNRGTMIDAGAHLNVDTEGPALTGIALNPGAPIKNDSAPTITAVFTLSKAMKSGQFPQISYKLSAPLRTSVALAGIAQVNQTTWQVSFTLPADAGLGNPETISFAFLGTDDLDNVSTKISAQNKFQVYRGDLPPLDAPLGFAAQAQPGGKVKLSWQPVADAAVYQLYRKQPSDAGLELYQRASGEVYIDQTPADGRYQYAVATVRQSNGQESISDQTAPIEVIASATAPGAPANLALVLTGQGIGATWQPPVASDVATYNLYRASGTTITSIAGLTPLKTGIKQDTAVDASPSTTEHAYVVTALDAAGNESAISNSAYLNAALLPVSTMTVQQLANDLPVVSWTASKSSSVAGYNVYIGSDSALVKLTSSPIASLSFTDSGYTSGERRYTVSAVDTNGVEMPRSVTMPSLSMQVVSGLPLLRGVMNQLQVQVTNLSASTAADGIVVIKANGKDHRSDSFTLAPNETKLVPVVVGGYTDLPGQATLQIGVELVPNEGELVRVTRNTTADVGDGALVVGISTDEFTRGGTGKVRLTVENTSAVEIELLTALSNGGQDSSELRFKILDADGNVLATQPYRQVFGSNVITLVTGQTVARIPAGAKYTSDVFNLNVPSASPNSIRVRLEVDKLRYHTGQTNEVVIAGRGSERNVTLVDTAYFAEISNVTPVNSFGDQDIVITGRAVDRQTQAGLPNTRVKLVFNQQGYERIFSVVTDAAGEFTYTFTPTTTDAGLYKVSAVHPDITDRPEQKAFTINRVTVSPTPYKLDIPKNYPFSIPFAVKAGPGTSATNLRLVLDAASQPTGEVPAGISTQLPVPVSVTERQTRNLPVVFTANNSAQPSGSLILNVISDEHQLTPIGQVRINYTLSEAKPFLTSTPSYIETGMARGGSEVESVTIENKGLQDALNLSFTLNDSDGGPAPSWVAIASSASGTLAIGAKRSVDLSFTPPAATPEGVYQFKLTVQGDNVPSQSLNVFASITQSGQGNVFFKAADIYTATVDKNGNLIPGLAGATISLQNEDVTTITQELVTDSLGEALFQNMPAGRYKFRAKASNHQEVGGRVLVKPGITINQPLFLEYNLVTVEWTVREITIQDRYEITLNATYETDVPAAVVVMQPASINLPKMNPGDVYYGELSLTNHGLIRADNVKQQLPQSDGFFRYEFLVDVPSTLEAKQRVTIPYRVIALTSLEDGTNSTASGGGCYSYSNVYRVSCDFICKNGSISSCGASSSWFSYSNSSCTSSGGGGGGGGGGGFGGGGFGGGGGSTPIKLKGKKCVHVPKGNGSQCE